MNRDPSTAVRLWAPLSQDEWGRIEERVRRVVRVRDDFVQVPFPRLVDTSTQQIAAAVAGYRREAVIVDTRLSREVSLQFKATALSDLCDRLRADTGIHLEAGRSVADEKVTLFCKAMPLRDVMRQLSRPFGYTWLRSGAPSSSPNAGGEPTDYRYELVQDLRSQLLEEELRNRDRNAALLAVDREMSRYRPYLSLSPDEALARSRTAPPEEKRLLEYLAGKGWGPTQLYFRLSSQDLAGLRAGQRLTFSAEPGPGEQPLPSGLARGVLQSFRDKRVVLQDDLFRLRDAADAPDGVPLASMPEARARVTLWMGETELGKFTLDGDSGVRSTTRPGAYATGSPLAFAVSPSVRSPQNRVANARSARDPTLQRGVTLEVEGQGSRVKGQEPGSGTAHDARRTTHDPRPSTLDPKVTSADVLEALHRGTGLPIVADFYTRLYRPVTVSVQNQPLFEALNQLADAMHLRWNKEAGTREAGAWLQFRSASYFNDRLKEVPNRLLSRWAAARREHGALTLDDLLEIVQLSDAQLDAEHMAEGARARFGLAEWDLAHIRGGPRPHLRFLAGFTPAQRQSAMSASGLAFTQMSLPKQQQFIALALGSQADRLPSLAALAGATTRVDYMLPGGFQWRPPAAPDGPYWRSLVPSPVRERTREAALQAARRIHPHADAAQIVPTELALTVIYSPGGPDAAFTRPFILRTDKTGNHSARGAFIAPRPTP